MQLKKLVDVAAGRIPADIVIKNGIIACVYSGAFFEADIALCGGFIAGIGSYDGQTVIDACGQTIIPGLIDSHIHIESSFLCPEELGRLLAPHGTSTLIVDPHEIVNVAGLPGLEFMFESAKKSPVDIKFNLPSCVPATPFETSGAALDAQATRIALKDPRILGLAEFMDFSGVADGGKDALDKIAAAHEAGKFIDGHCPGLSGKRLNAYCAAGIHSDHECTTPQEVIERLRRGMYVMLREGSACRELRQLLKAVTPENSRRCLLCSDDLQPETVLQKGHIENYLRICVEEGLDAITAIRMATLNAAEYAGLSDRGAIAPSLRADLVFVDNTREWNVKKVILNGRVAAENGRIMSNTAKKTETSQPSVSVLGGCFNVREFSQEKLRLPLRSEKVYVIGLSPGSVVTEKLIIEAARDADGNFVFEEACGAAKIAVIERHHNTGQVGIGLIRGYGINRGAIAISIAHDSHNIIVIGANDGDMAQAVEALLAQDGGIVLWEDGVPLVTMPLPIAGLMGVESGEWTARQIALVNKTARETLGVADGVDPILALCFMSLPVIPALKLTCRGLFDVVSGGFIALEAE